MVRFQEVFFFKQKTAYEMRISDWSSDVCSSDLGCGMASSETASAASVAVSGAISIAPATTAMAGKSLPGMAAICRSAGAIGGAATASGATSSRSEEHTSELQSLMRNSYAVFCLKKKKTQRQTTTR